MSMWSVRGSAVFLLALFDRGFALREPVQTLGTLADAQSVLYVMRTSKGTHEHRLPGILSTWAAGLPTDSLLIVGPPETESESPKIYAATGCADDHEWGICCKTGHALGLAASKIGFHDWVFLVDDDLYVNTTNVESALGKRDASQKLALGIGGCRVGFCDDSEFGGFCGGAGYAISRAALKALVDKPGTQYKGEYLKGLEQWYGGLPWAEDDVGTTCLLRQRGVAIEELKGLHVLHLSTDHWEADGEQLDPQYPAAIHAADPVALTFHYVSPTEMYMIRDEFAKPVNKSSLLDSRRSASDLYEEQLEQYRIDRNKRRPRAPAANLQEGMP